ncbi:MAG: sulfate adenylyltransferase [Actinomycetota bacterium]
MHTHTDALGETVPDQLPAAHGGPLVHAVADDSTRERWLEDVPGLPSLEIGACAAADLECIAIGAYSPLRGFMGRSDYESVLKEMHLESGTAWTLPITLSATDEQVKNIGRSENTVLTHDAEPLAILHVEEIFTYDRQAEARHVYRTEDPAHPGVACLATQGNHLIGGPISLIGLPSTRRFPDRRITPLQTRREFASKGWRQVAGFQTRRPMHRSHEYLTKCVLETVDGLLLHALASGTKVDNVSAGTRLAAYQALIDDFYPAARVILGVFPATMRYAGPREAVFHALCRKNYGCTHFIVGRDHAGISSYYGSFEAHTIFDEFTPDELGIVPVLVDHAFWCRLCGQMATAKTCPHSPEERVALSGTEVRRRLSAAEPVPQEFTRPQVAEVLRQAMHAATPPGQKNN